MRISDWSSDVCSSDLRRQRRRYQLLTILCSDFVAGKSKAARTLTDAANMGSPKMRRQKQAVRACTLFEDGLPRLPSKLGIGADKAVDMRFVDLHRLMHRLRREDRRQTSSASGREGVEQYVDCSGAATSETK